MNAYSTSPAGGTMCVARQPSPASSMTWSPVCQFSQLVTTSTRDSGLDARYQSVRSHEATSYAGFGALSQAAKTRAMVNAARTAACLLASGSSRGEAPYLLSASKQYMRRSRELDVISAMSSAVL